jgi:hypothetical protein
MIVVLSITLNKNISNWDPPRKFNPWIRLLSYCLECVGGGNKNQVQLLVNDCITPSPIKMMSTAWDDNNDKIVSDFSFAYAVPFS